MMSIVVEVIGVLALIAIAGMLGVIASQLGLMLEQGQKSTSKDMKNYEDTLEVGLYRANEEDANEYMFDKVEELLAAGVNPYETWDWSAKKNDEA